VIEQHQLRRVLWFYLALSSEKQTAFQGVDVSTVYREEKVPHFNTVMAIAEKGTRITTIVTPIVTLGLIAAMVRSTLST
jgi:hypothetical protein